MSDNIRSKVGSQARIDRRCVERDGEARCIAGVRHIDDLADKHGLTTGGVAQGCAPDSRQRKGAKGAERWLTVRQRCRPSSGAEHWWSGDEVHGGVASTLLRLWLRLVADSLLPRSIYSGIGSSSSDETADGEARLSFLLLLLLPPPPLSLSLSLSAAKQGKGGSPQLRFG
jgi:hypothetical protein